MSLAVVSLELPEKQVVQRRFGARASSYDSATPVQERMGRDLLALLGDQTTVRPGTICVDLGCGTGRFSAQVSEWFGGTRVLGLDVCPEMVEQARRLHPDHSFAVADAEEPDFFMQAGLGLVVSNAMLQWANDPVSVIRRWHRRLVPEGRLAFSLLVDGTFRELKSSFDEAYQRHGLLPRQHVLPLWKAEQVKPALPLRSLRRKRYVSHYPSVGGFLRAVRQAGVTTHGAAVKPVARSLYRTMTECYQERFLEPGRGICASYEVLFGIL